MSLTLKHQSALRSVDSIHVMKSGNLREAYIVRMLVGGVLRTVWEKPVYEVEPTGWVFTQGRPISVSGRFIRLNGQQ